MRAVIIDDEELARENMRLMLKEHCPEIEVVGTASGVASGLNALERFRPEVVFLDIRMPSGEEGFDLLEQVQRLDFLVIFVTAFKDYAIEAFRVNAVDYILKPIDIDDLEAAVARAASRHALHQDTPAEAARYRQTLSVLPQLAVDGEARLTIHHQGGIKIVKEADIRYLKADGNCTRLFFSDAGQYLDTRTLKVYEELLDPSRFFRTHKSYMVNLAALKEYRRTEGHTALLDGGEELPISRHRLSDFLDRLKSL